jgi:hypothetical protein
MKLNGCVCVCVCVNYMVCVYYINYMEYVPHVTVLETRHSAPAGLGCLGIPRPGS